MTILLVAHTVHAGVAPGRRRVAGPADAVGRPRAIEGVARSR